MHEVEVGGARTVFASLMPTHFLKQLFIQSEAESGKFGEVSRVLHFAVKHIQEHIYWYKTDRDMVENVKYCLK